jgi:tetratricopeptide (TPR) repeat protein
MKKNNRIIIAINLVLMCMINIQAQIVVPDESPFSSVTQKVGFNQITVEYVRPNVRGRVVFGDVVPFREKWLDSEKAYAQITFSDDVLIQDDKSLKAGTYSIYAIPGKDEWTIALHKYTWNYGLRIPFYYFEPDIYDERVTHFSEEKDAVRFTVKPEKLKDQVETFTIQVANVCHTCAEIQLMWDFTKVSFRINTESDKKVLADIKTFTTNPEGRLAGEYYLAAKYYLDTNRELDKALEWANKSIQYTPEAYWVIHTKAEILAKMGNYKAAIEAATLSEEKAKAKKDEDYVRMNELEIAKWKSIKKGS